MLYTITLDTFTYNKTDIPLETIRRALSGMYHDPDSAARHDQNAHYAFFARVVEDVQKIPELDPAKAVPLLERFKEQYLKRVQSMLGTQSGIVSWHIAGRSRYPVQRMQKRMNTDRKKTDELMEWREYRLKRICSVLKRMSNPLTRLEQWQHDLTVRETRQAHMKAVNALIRKHKAQDTPALRAELETHGIKDTAVSSLLAPAFCKQTGYPSYAIQNNNAQIRRLKILIKDETAKEERAKEEPRSETTINGVRVEEDLIDNRLRLYYPTKPDQETITKLKKNGWNWSRRQGAWQRILTANARYDVKNFILK